MALSVLSATGAACSTGSAASPNSGVLPVAALESANPLGTTNTVATAATTTTTTTPPSTTTTTPPATTTTSPSTTTTAAAPTVVVTLPQSSQLPQPLAPPSPRAAEPYVELGRLEIPAIGLDHAMLQGITLTTLDRGPGHWPGTAMPGQQGNVVVAGHRTSHGKEFRRLDRLVPGDEVIFTTADGRFVYTVTKTTIVTPDAMYIIDQTMDATATLFACHPPGSTRQRIVVHLALQP